MPLARHQLHLPSDTQLFETAYYDAEGRLALEFRSGEYVTYEPDGSSVLRKRYQSMELMCRCQYHPGLSKRPLTTCRCCRYPAFQFPLREKPRHGLLCLQHAHTCVRCQVVLCGHHTKKIKGRPYCGACARKTRLKNAFLGIVTYDEEP